MHRILILILIISLSASCKTYFHLANTSTQSLNVTQDQTDQEVSRLVAPYKNNLDAQMNEVIAVALETMVKARPESTLTNWVADAIQSQSIKAFNRDIDFSYQNFGGIRIPELPKGNISLGKIFELMPFDNIVVLVTIEGNDLIRFMQYIADAGGSPVSSNVQMSIQAGKISRCLINGKPINTHQMYTIALPDYIANGGDNADFFKGKAQITKNVLIRDLLIRSAKESKIVKPVLDQRISIIQ